LARAIAASLQSQLAAVDSRNGRLEKELVAGRGKLAHLESRMAEELAKFGQKLQELERKGKEVIKSDL
jgi:predicted  nucleic acid-binding Zn-ribbon protein